MFLGLPGLIRPASGSARDRMPWYDWALALMAGFCGSYLYVFYNELAGRPGQPTPMDVATAAIGPALLLEATRRAPGLPTTVLGLVFVAYALAGPWLPDVLAHRGASLERLMSHMWLTTEGVYGVALGVSVSCAFLHLRAVGLHAGQVRRRQLHDAGVVRAAGAPAGRPGQGGRGVFRRQRPGIGLVGGQRGDRRDFHDTPDEEGRLRRRARRGDRNRVLGQRPDHAAGDGRGRVPDDRIRRHPLYRHHPPRDPAGRDLLHRPLLHRPPGGPEAGDPAHDGLRARAHAAASSWRDGAWASAARWR